MMMVNDDDGRRRVSLVDISFLILLLPLSWKERKPRLDPLPVQSLERFLEME